MTSDLSVLLINGHPRETLNKQLSSLGSQGYAGEIVVADGVPEPFPEKMRDYLGGKVIHRPMAEDQGPVERARNFFNRFKMGVAACNGDFVSLCPSDDLLIVETLRKAHEFLVGNPDSVTCMGHGLRQISKRFGPYRQTPVNLNVWKARLAYHAYAGSSFFWAVHRKSTLERALNCVCEVDSHSQSFSEHLFYFLMLLVGNVGRVSGLLLVKDYFDVSRPQTSTEGFHGNLSVQYWSSILEGVEAARGAISAYAAEIGIRASVDELSELLFQYLLGMVAFRIDKYMSAKIEDKQLRFQQFDTMTEHRDLRDLYSEFRRFRDNFQSQVVALPLLDE